MFFSLPAMHNYKREELVGSGSFGKVYRGRQISSGRVVAMKLVQRDDSEGMPSTTIREVSALKGTVTVPVPVPRPPPPPPLP